MPTRDFSFVTDTVAAMLAAAKAPESAIGSVLNVGAGKEISIGELASLIGELMDVAPEIVVEEHRERPEGSEVERLLCDSTKAREVLGWKPEVSLREGLSRTVEWIQENARRYRDTGYRV